MPTNAEKLINRHALPNGLILEFWDHSRPVTGDRWFVHLETRIAVPIGAKTLALELKPLEEQIIMALGTEIIFSRTEERNFIATEDLPGLLKDLQDRMLQLTPGYFGHKDFAAKFIRKTYVAWQEQQSTQVADQR